MTGGSIPNSKDYLKTTYVLNEKTWDFDPLADMMYERDAHGMISWRDKYIIVIGSWHIEVNLKKCEIYDIA